MRRDNPLTTYVSDETKDEIEQRARDEDETISTYVDRLIRRELAREAEEDIASEMRAEERIREVATLAMDEIEQTTERMREDLQRTLDQVEVDGEKEGGNSDDEESIFDELRGDE